MAEFISTSDECSLVEATIQEIQHFSAELLRIKTSLLGARIPAPWLCRDMLSNSVKALKQAAKQASDTCTKIGVIGVEALKGEVKESILKELIEFIRQAMSIFMAIVQGAEFCGPMMEYICLNLRAEFHLIGELLTLIEKGGDVSLNSPIGMVWKANDRVQKLPITNKAAYRRAVLESLSVIEDTSREFEEYLETSRADDGKASEEEDADMDEFGLEEMGTYSPEEFHIIEAALLLITNEKTIIKASLNCACEIAERVSSVANPQELKVQCFLWVADIVTAIKNIETAVVDLGAELYSPIDEEVINKQKECNLSNLIGLGQKVMHPAFDIAVIKGDIAWSEQYAAGIDSIKKILTI